jgi:hypothetical protein
MTTILEQIKSNWVLITTIALFISTTAINTYRLSAVEVKAENNESAIEHLKEIKIDIAVIKSDIQTIKEKLR